jgi:RHS repeat-associated protein
VTRRLLFLVVVALIPATAFAQSETVEYYGLDALGSVRVVFDASGNVLTRVDYTPFGAEVVPAAGLPDQRFAGLFRDPEAGLDYAQARSYQVRTGRFNAPDPVYAGMFDPQGWNRYSYGLNAPTVYTDRTGLSPLDGYFSSTLLAVVAGSLDRAAGQQQAPFLGLGVGGEGFYAIDALGLDITSGGGVGGQTPTPPDAVPPGPAPNPTPDPTPDPNPNPNPDPPQPSPDLPRDWRACTKRWSFSSTARMLGGDAIGSTARVAEIVSPISLFSDGVAMIAKGPGKLGTRNPYASGLNWGIRTVGKAAAARGVIQASTWGAATSVGGYVSAVVLAPVGAFTSAYNGTVMVQCAAGTLR